MSRNWLKSTKRNHEKLRTQLKKGLSFLTYVCAVYTDMVLPLILCLACNGRGQSIGVGACTQCVRLCVCKERGGESESESESDTAIIGKPFNVAAINL